MPILHPSAPIEGADIAANSFQDAALGPENAADRQLLATAKADELSLAEPHQVYTVALNDLAEGKLLQAAAATSWRYLVVQGTQAIAEVELAHSPDQSAALGCRGVHQSPFSNDSLTALRMAEDLAETQAADFELRCLRIPGVCFAALWLHGVRDDLIIPLQGAPHGLKEHALYNESAVLEVLKPLAKAAKTFNDEA